MVSPYLVDKTISLSTRIPNLSRIAFWFADYSMYSTFLTVSPGSVLFSRSDLLKRKDLCFSCLRLGLIRHRRSLRSSHLSSQVRHDSHRVTLEPVRPHHGVRLMTSSLSASLFHRFSSAPDLSLIFLESLEYYFELWSSILISNCLFQFFLSVSVALMNPITRQSEIAVQTLPFPRQIIWEKGVRILSFYDAL